MAKQRMIQYVSFYTDGSAARKITPAAPMKSAVLPKQKKQKRKVIHLDPVAVLGVAVAACMLIMMLVGVSALNSAKEETQLMRSYVDNLTEKNAELSVKYESGYNLEEIRTTALALGMIPAQQATQTTISVAPAEVQEYTANVWTNLAMVLTDIVA